MTDHSEKISRLSALNTELNTLADAATVTIDAFEASLQQAKASVAVWLDGRDDLLAAAQVARKHTGFEFEITCSGWFLGWRRNGVWGLYVVPVETTYTEKSTSTWRSIVEKAHPVVLRDAPRKVRIQAVHKLSRLLDALIEKTSEHIKAGHLYVPTRAVGVCVLCKVRVGETHMGDCSAAPFCDCWAQGRANLHAPDCASQQPYESEEQQ